MNRTSTLISALFFSAFVAMPAASADANKDSADKSSDALNPSLSLELGRDAYEVKLGMGAWTDNNTNYGQVFISHFKTEDTLKVNGHSLSEQKYRATRIGIDVDGFGLGSGKAFHGSAFLYSNESQANIDRYGVGLALAFGRMLTHKARIQAGFEIMPEFFSTDWDADALFEYEYNLGATYRLTDTIDTRLIYRYGGTIDDINVKHYSQLMAGISLKI